jgi:hypothetical protein
MPSRADIIEVDQITADTLKARAAEHGVSVAELLAEVACESGPVACKLMILRVLWPNGGSVSV